jgi:hypothetical protein
MTEPTDRIYVNVGGEIFETTTLTLMGSGAGYFQGLLGPTGSALGTLTTTHPNKRTRLSDENPDSAEDSSNHHDA